MEGTMKSFIALATLFAIQAASASINQAPPSFPHKNGNAVFVDFTDADYRITYDLTAKTAVVESELEFQMPSQGHPIFDLIPEPTDLKLDGNPVSASLTSDPDGESKFRVISTSINTGRHRLTMKHTLVEGVSFKSTGVASAFWMSDLDDRQYLEQFLPTNFEFDQIPMKIRVEIIGAAGTPHVLRANGDVKKLSENSFEVEFPRYFTTSSMYFHLLPESAVPSTQFNYRSVDGRTLPVEIYTFGTLSTFTKKVEAVLKELESDYGPFPHPKVIVYGAGSGGMEYSGATVSDYGSIGHELFHSYNARGVMPSQGNSGWMDESISSWRDRGYKTSQSPGPRTKLAGHSVWTRMTDMGAYTRGAAFLEWMAGKMEDQGKSFKAFLRDYFRNQMHTTVTTETFRLAMEGFSSLDLSTDFNQYIYGSSPKSTGGTDWGVKTVNTRNQSCGGVVKAPRSVIENPFHPRLTREQVRALLWPR